MASNTITCQYAPPAGLPPVLDRQQHDQLSRHGYLFLPLADPLVRRLQALSEAASAFFDQEDEVKRAAYPSGSGTEQGYYQVEEEKEYVTFRCKVNPDSNFETEAREVWQEAGRLLCRILRELAQARGLPVTVWDSITEGAKIMPATNIDLVMHKTLMRVFRYLPTSGVAAPHVDIGLITLCVGTGEGLQVLHRSEGREEWLDCKGPTVLVADSLRVLLQNTVSTCTHRVVGNAHGRSSVVYAMRPCLRDPIDMSTFGGYGLVDAQEFWKQIQGSRFDVNASKDVRDKQFAQQRKQEDEEIARLDALTRHQPRRASSLFAKMGSLVRSKKKATT